MADVSLIVATTLSDWAPDIADSVSDRNALMAFMKTKDKANSNRGGYRSRMVVVEGGDQFKETIFFTTNNTFKGYADRATIDTQAGNPVKEAQYPHRIVAGSINLSLLEEAQNTTKYQIHNLTKVKREEAEISMAEIMGSAALSDGTTDTLIPAGVQSIVSTTVNTVGTISETANPSWGPFRDATGVTAWNTADEGLIALDAAYERTTRQTEKVDAIVTTPAIKSLVNIMVMKNLQINIESNKLMGELGYDTVKYRGATVMADDNVPTGTLFGLNTAIGFRFNVLSKGNYEITKMKQPIGGLFNVMQLYVFSNFTSGSRRLNFVMTGITG